MPCARLASCFAMLRYSGLMRWQVQVEGDARAARADHHLVRQRAQRFGVAWLAMVARDQVLALELLPGAELPGAEQRDEVVQLTQVVLKRRGGEQQDEIPLDFLDELVGRAPVALHLLRLVHDHQVPPVPQDLLGVPPRARAVVRDDRPGDGPTLPVVGVGRSLEALEKLLLELPLPL